MSILLDNNTKILFSIISTIIIYVATNCASPSINNFDSSFWNFIYHAPGTVCPFGIICGKIMLLICIIQVYFLYTDQYSYIRTANIILLLLGFLASFMNYIVLIKIIPAFILQLLIITC